MIFDCHTHVGFWDNSFITPDVLANQLRKIGIDRAAVMPTFSREGDGYLDIDIDLYYDIQENYSNFFDIILAVTPHRLEISPDLKIFENTDYKAIKIHPTEQKWDINQEPINRVFHICSDRNIPLMIHTSDDNSSNSANYNKLIAKYSNVKVILCHARPYKEAALMLQQHTNCYVDTAFLPIESILNLIESGFENKIIFGSDFPVHSNFNTIENYNNTLTKLQKELTIDYLEQILSTNYKSVF